MHFAQGIGQLFGWRILQQVAGHAGFQRAAQEPAARERGDDDHLDRQCVPLDALREFQAGQARHFDIGHQQVGLEPLQFAPRAFTVGRRSHHLDVGFHAEQRGQRATQHRLVFGEEDAQNSGPAQKLRWEEIKAAERAAKAQHGVLDDVPVGMPALHRAAKLTKRAARVGFDWPSTDEVFDKLAEEVEELRVEIAAGDKDRAREELGDLLFVVANLARKLEVEPEDALRAANAKFIRRFGFIEAELARDGRTPEQSNLAEMDALWDAAKAAEKG